MEKLNDYEMIEQFLKYNNVTKLEDADYITDGTSRKQNYKSISLVPKLNSRAVQRFTCEICGAKDCPVVNNKHIRNKGKVDGEDKGNIWCEKCRRQKIKENANKKQVIREYGSLDNKKKYIEIKDSCTKKAIENEKQITELLNIKNSLKITYSIKSKKYIIERMRLVDERIATIRKNIDWDDWDTPLNHTDYI